MAGVRKLISFGSKFRMCLTEVSNYFNVSHRKPGPPPGFSGIEGETLQVLVQSLGVNFDYYIPEVFGYGTYTPNGTFTGCNDLMQRKKVDVVIIGSYYDLQDVEIAQPVLSHFQTPVNFITKIPDEAPKFDVLLKTFDMASFIAIGITILFISLVFFLLTKRKDSYVTHLISRIADLVSQEPLVKMEMTLPLEVLTMFWMIGAQFITFFFTAVILTALLLPNHLPPVDDKHKLLKAILAEEYKVVTYKRSSYLLHLESSPIEEERKIGNIMRENDWLMILNQSNIFGVLQNNTALITTDSQTNMLIPPDYPHITSKDTVYNTVCYCFYSSRSFPLKEKLNKIMWRMVESGVIEKVYRIYRLNLQLTLFRNSKWGSELAWRPLSLQDLQGAFIFLAIGLIISFVIFTWEVILHRVKYMNCKR